RGRAPVRFTLQYSPHGPLLGGALGAPASDVAVRWSSADPAHSIRGIGNLNHARNWPEFLAAVRDFQDPSQNVIFADTAGHIGYVMGGRVPLRGSADPATARTPPILPVPGWTGEWDWKGYLPFEQHPHVLDPPDGYVVTANNRQDTSALARLITTDWMPPWRAARIREMIRGGGAQAPRPVPGGGLRQPEVAPARAFDAAAILRMQMDVHDALAERYRGRALEAATGAGLRALANELAAWNASASPDSHTAAVFESWVLELGHLEAVSLYGSPRPGYFPSGLEDRTLEEGRLPWDPDTAAFRGLAVRAMRAADSVARGKTWGELNHVIVAHALGTVRPLQWLLRLNLGPAPRGGSPATVNVSDWSGGVPPVTTPYGPSQRHVVDMGDPDGSGGFILPTGESGLPFEPHYRDMYPAWRDGRLWRIPLDSVRARARAVHFLELVPATTTSTR
ncbi:MAG TPA: penicillin acylase family protein, partial [Longimicrobiales bacterium]